MPGVGSSGGEGKVWQESSSQTTSASTCLVTSRLGDATASSDVVMQKDVKQTARAQSQIFNLPTPSQ